MSLREFIRINREIEDSEVAKVILGNYYSWSTVTEVEEMLGERQKQLRDLIEQLRTDLENVNLSEEKRREIFERIMILEKSSISEYFSLPIADTLDTLLDSACVRPSETELNADVSRTNTLTAVPRYFTFDDNDGLSRSASVASPTSTWLFVGEYVEDGVQWRAVSYEVLKRIKKDSDFPDIMPPSQKPEDQCPRGIDEDSLSHFQNCPMPPGSVMPNSETSTQFESHYVLMNGCSVSITLNISNSASQIGGMKWKKSKKQLRGVSGLCVKPQMRYLGDSIRSSTCYQSFSVNIRNSWRKPYLPFWASRLLSSAVIMPRLSANFAFYSYSSDCDGKRNSVIVNGEID